MGKNYLKVNRLEVTVTPDKIVKGLILLMMEEPPDGEWFIRLPEPPVPYDGGREIEPGKWTFDRAEDLQAAAMKAAIRRLASRQSG